MSLLDWRLIMGNSPSAKETVSEPETPEHVEDFGQLYSPPSLKNKSLCRFLCVKVGYVFISVINILLSIALIAVAVSAAIAMKIFSTEQSSRLVALILVSIISAITISITIYAMVAVLRNHCKHVRTASTVLFMLALILSIIIGVSMRISDEDEIKLSRSLSESFRLSREDSPRHVKLWAAIQNDLRCCGVYSSEDYRIRNLPDLFPPDVTISCCPSYDPGRSQLIQEREREFCRAKREYYANGCRVPVIELFREMTKRVMTITIVVIIVMVLMSIHGAIWTHCCRIRAKKIAKTPSMNISIQESGLKSQMSTKT